MVTFGIIFYCSIIRMFSKEDFSGDNIEKLRLIIMNQLGFDLFTSFHSLSANNKEKFNIALNRYINELGEEWEYIMNNDFQFICSEKIFVDGFDPEMHLPRVINHEIQVLNALKQSEEESNAENNE